ncbi:MAG: YlxR family protein [Chloroflexota bacterium]
MSSGSKKKPRRGKHIPTRTCVGCRTTNPKRSLIRIVSSPDGVKVDPTGKLAGRGAYIHYQRTCWEVALKGSLAHALRTNISPEDMETLKEYMATIPDITKED